MILVLVITMIVAACGGGDDDRSPADAQVSVAEESSPAPEPAAASEQVQPEPEPVAEAEAVPSLGDPARGQVIFFANACNVCHGDQGEGGIGPTIAATALTLDEVILQYREPREAMPPFSEAAVPDLDVADVYAWLQSLR